MFQNQGNMNNGGVLGTGGPNTMDPTQQQHQQQNMNYNGMHNQIADPQTHDIKSIKGSKMKPYVKIIEQPAGKALRFRYECEGRSAGSIPGVNSTPENKTYPTIQIVGYKGRAVVVVSCVTKDSPYRPHPHNLVGKEGCKKGVCTLEINSETMRAVFSNLGIQCVKKKDIEAALKAREDIRVDPFKTGFAHRNPNEASKIDLNSVRLCFQVFMESDQRGRFTQPLAPVVSDPIYDKKAMSDLVICRLCSCSASVLGNTQIILLCEKVAKEDITVRFFEEDESGKQIWEAFGDFQHTDVHKQTAITFKTPIYRNLEITEPAKVFIQLKRPSDGVTSEKLPFEYKPLDSDPAHLRRKRQKTNGDPRHLLFQHQNDHNDGRFVSWNTPNIPAIKAEPRDPSPQPYVHYGGQQELAPSPQPLSPSNKYNPQSTPSPYSMSAATPGGNNQLLSPNHQTYGNGPTNGGTVPPNTAPSPMDMQEYTVFGQQANANHGGHPHQQQQYQGNIFPAAANATNWGQKSSAYNNNHTQAGNNMSNLNSTNPFTMHNLLNNSHHPSTSAGNPGSLHWNLTPNLMSQQHHLQANLPQEATNQQQYQIGNDQNVAGVASSNHSSANNENGPTISNLLGLDSEQLVRINSEDLRLNSEDLQISNLSIST